MILGRLNDLDAQRAILPPALVRSIEMLLARGLSTLPPGRHELEGDRLFALVQDATPRRVENSLIEAHADYADVQIPLTASECFGFSHPQPGLAPCDDQFAERDLAFYPTPESEAFFDVAPGEYAFFLPGELHRPCITFEEPAPFRKIVIKIHRELLSLS